MITGLRGAGGPGGPPASPPPSVQEAPSQHPCQWFRTLSVASPQQVASTSVKTLTSFCFKLQLFEDFS